MKIIPLLSLSLIALTLYGAMGSSVKIPVQEHLKYTFGNHKNHAIQKIEAQHYYRSLAPLDDQQIRDKLVDTGYSVSSLVLSDIVYELVYVAHVNDKSGKKMKLYLDPTTGNILETRLLK